MSFGEEPYKSCSFIRSLVRKLEHFRVTFMYFSILDLDFFSSRFFLLPPRSEGNKTTTEGGRGPSPTRTRVHLKRKEIETEGEGTTRGSPTVRSGRLKER